MHTWRLGIISCLCFGLLAGCHTTTRAPLADQEYMAGQALYQQQDYHLAFEKLLSAATRGQANAQYAVGYMLFQGIGVKRDEVTGLKWLKRSANKGNPRAVQALQKLEDQLGKG